MNRQDNGMCWSCAWMGAFKLCSMKIFCACRWLLPFYVLFSELPLCVELATTVAAVCAAVVAWASVASLEQLLTCKHFLMHHDLQAGIICAGRAVQSTCRLCCHALYHAPDSASCTVWCAAVHETCVCTLIQLDVDKACLASCRLWRCTLFRQEDGELH